MRLCKSGLEDKAPWIAKGYRLPLYNIKNMRQRTKERPSWLHIGAGNIFRSFPAVLQQHLLNEGFADTGIIVTELFDEEILDKAYLPYDNLSIAVTLKANGEIDKEVVASVAESVKHKTGCARLREIFTASSLQLVSYTITENGYALRDARGNYFPWIERDLQMLDPVPQSPIALTAKLCYERYKTGKAPLALVSMDNFSRNGTVLRDAVMTFVSAWVEQGLFSEGFYNYMTDEDTITFNWTMIDKITPRPAETIMAILSEEGIEEISITCTEKNTYVAPFVNAEEAQYLAIEDRFPNGRPFLEQAGVYFSDAQTIDRMERMKVCACLNPLHTVLAIFGCLLGYSSVAEEMKNPLLKGFIEQMGYAEGLPVVEDPGIINARDFLKEAIEVRFPNPFIPDSPQRIATDSSKKIPIRFGETLKAYRRTGKDDLSFLTFIPLFFAGWLRYLTGLDDNGNIFKLSPDPNLPEILPYVSGINPGDTKPFDNKLKPLLSRSDIFGLDLYTCGLGNKVESLFEELNRGIGAVEETIRRYVKKPIPETKNL